MSSFQLASLSGDAENMMTPARRERLARRNQATMARRARERAEAEAAAFQAMTGVLPAKSGRHHVVVGEQRSYLGGILLTDGTIHLFDRYQMEHADYADKLGVGIRCGNECEKDTTEDGWGFYVDHGEFGPYYVPKEYQEVCERVVLELVDAV